MTPKRWIYRAGCPMLKLILFCLLMEIPHSTLRIDDGASFHWNLDEITSLVTVAFISTLSFYLVQGSDPGYITEDIVLSMDTEGGGFLTEDDEDDEAQQRKEIEYRKRKIELMEQALATSEVERTEASDSNITEPNEAATSMEFCSVCSLQPPLRAYHCSYCNKCVATFDHHCFFIGTCIGERNHGRFWLFIFLSCIEVAMCLSIVHSGFRAESTLKIWLKHNGMALAAAMFFWFFAFLTFSLFGFHTFLLLTNTTTRELGKGPDELKYLQGTRECDLPFSNGLCGNLRNVCCIHPGWCSNKWTPRVWKPVGKINRESENICENLWENKYYSCC
ncbi:palmitoyltransferase ZDHHC12 [Thraustotheca clavata]|uniref:Palmitoyltransferase n=1 Tax=Thraustotheca clavata TaxID=74557 RepID=A0A1W0A230_9STRA|nr:palmitoyltransferase ZDHHC12 [Thraustotheca clavata]